MEVSAIKTHPIHPGEELLLILDRYIPELHEDDILAVTSKIVSICEGAIVKNDGKTDKFTLIRQEADSYLDLPLSETYGMTITIKDHKLVANSGIDESNGNGYFILWPREPFTSAAMIWKHIRQKSHLKNFGVIITDTHVAPLQWGTRGRAIAWCGIEPLKNYIGSPDIFGKNLHATKASVIDSLGCAAVAIMGEGNEQTPIALIRNFSFASFMNRPPTQKEMNALELSIDDDIYAPILTSIPWVSGKS